MSAHPADAPAKPSRRGVAAGLGLLLAGGAYPDRAFADTLAGAVTGLRAQPAGRDRLWLVRPDGSEILSRFRTAEGVLDDTQLLTLSWFMRDVNDGDAAVRIEPRLFDLMASVQTSLSEVHGSPLPLTLTSGYRTPNHNASLETAARNSMHVYGYAADLAVRGYPPRALALAASFFSNGGIGLYETFTHLDVWRPRTWIGKGRNGHC